MPRYYFPSWDGDRFFEDGEGIELDEVEQACALAVASLTELAGDVLPGSSGERVLRVRVLDDGQEPLVEYRLRFEVLPDA